MTLSLWLLVLIRYPEQPEIPHLLRFIRNDMTFRWLPGEEVVIRG